jgi:hypothetical protein
LNIKDLAKTFKPLKFSDIFEQFPSLRKLTVLAQNFNLAEEHFLFPDPSSDMESDEVTYGNLEHLEFIC